jgi:ribosomal protein L11 methyltransferase
MSESDILYCIKLHDVSSDAEMAVEFLSALEFQFSSWFDHIEKTAFHTLYFDSEAEAADAAKQLEPMLPQWREYDINISGLELFSIKREDWSEVWKKYFKVMQISEHLVIQPSWLEYDPEPGQLILEIDPGMSFGTGQHATTAFCLRMLDKLANRDDAPGVESFLDVGCGSGILSIAAAKLGYAPITAFDYDPDSVMIAGENYEINGLPEDAIALSVGDVTKYEASGYDVVAANILAHILRANCQRIVSYVRPGGYLMLSGILREEFAATAAEFTAAGVDLLESASEKEWTGGLFIKKG